MKSSVSGRLRKSFGVDIHQLRHTHATELINAGVSIEACHVLLGLARGLADGVLVGELGLAEAAAVLDHQLGRIGLPADV
ncbi:hypothetical protein ACWDOR_45775 [Streptosporangium canum]